MCITNAETVATPASGRMSVRYNDREVLHEYVKGVSGTAGRIEDLVHAVGHDMRPEVAGEDGRTALSVCLGALESIETGKCVNLT